MSGMPLADAWKIALENKRAIHRAIGFSRKWKSVALLGGTRDCIQHMIMKVASNFASKGHIDGVQTSTRIYNVVNWELKRAWRKWRTSSAWVRPGTRRQTEYIEDFDGPMVQSDRLRTLEDAFKHFNQRRVLVLCLRRGLYCLEPQSNEEIGDYLGVTRTRVSQIELRMIDLLGWKIRKPEAELI